MPTSIKIDLRDDLGTHLEHESTPIYHRLKFDATSIYLTKSFFHSLLTSRNEFGHYRLFSWDDYRARAFLGFEIGDVSPALGRAQLIGRFTPVSGNLEQVQYETRRGRFYFADAASALADRPSVRSDGIDPAAFWSLKEVIPTGAQGKAIYEDGNVIIDGAAGTGKSTTVLQRIRILLNEGVLSRAIMILVKNERVRWSFQDLLKSLGAEGVEIRLFDEAQKQLPALRAPSSEKARCAIAAWASSVSDDFAAATRFMSQPLGADAPVEQAAVTRLTESLEESPGVRNSLNAFVIARDSHRRLQNANAVAVRTSRATQERSIAEESQRQQRAAALRAKPGETASLADMARDRTVAGAAMKRLEESLRRMRASHEDAEKKSEAAILNSRNDLRDSIVATGGLSCTSASTATRPLVNLYLNRLIGLDMPFHTVIVDEAQDATLHEIEVAYLLSSNVILSGDELQSERSDAIGQWTGLGRMGPVFSKDGELRIRHLVRNFRQTYELGEASYNFRQSVLQRGLVGISDDYFENEKGFPRPSLRFIDADQQFIDVVQASLDFAAKTFLQSVPVTCFYENQASLKRMSALLAASNIGFESDTVGVCEAHVSFIDLKDIAGRQFAVVVAPLTAKTPTAQVYIMLTRAQFRLTFVTSRAIPLNAHLHALSDAGYLAVEH